MAAAAMFAAAVTAFAQGPADTGALTARSVFVNLQDQPLEILKRTTRLDMLDYWDADSVVKVKNAMEGLSWLTDVKEGYLKAVVTPVSQLEIKLLPVKNDTIVMTLYTVGASPQAQDTQVSFYDRSLRPLTAGKYFKAPELKQFLDIPKGAGVTVKELEEMVPFPTVRYNVNPDNGDLEAVLTVTDYMGVEARDKLKPNLRPSLATPWKGKYRF